MKKPSLIACGKIRTAALVTLSASMGWGGLVAQTVANPVGGQVVAGSASTHQAGSVTTVTQQTGRAIINWQNFSIGQGETVRFVQPGANSATLNRVVSLHQSNLDGQLQANGKVYLINPNGIVIGPSGRIEAGSFIASTLDVSNEQFLRGGDLTFSGSSSASVINRGTISALGGDVFMIARTVDNSGQINAAGTAGLAAGGEVLLRQAGDERLSVRATGGDGQVLNAGSIAAAQAELKAANGNIYALAINNTGVVRATTVQRSGGRILLKASGGEVANRGTLDASADAGAGGSVTVTGTRVGLYDGSRINADGTTAGGEVYVGGGKQGKDASIANAQATYVAAGAAISADATVNGNGGTIIVWGDESAQVYGQLSARGGVAGGNGGFVETSGKWIDLGSTPDVSASSGRAGEWLIDPDDLSIVAGSGTTNATTSPFATTGASAQIGVDLILTALNGGGSVTVSTADSGSGQAGDITLDVQLNFTGIGLGGQLVLNAHNDIILNQSVLTNGHDSLNLTLNADADGDGNGVIIVSPAVSLYTNGGDLIFNAPTYLGARFVNTGSQQGDQAGDLVFMGDLVIANPMGAEIGATGNGPHGDVIFNGMVNSGNLFTLVDDTTREWHDALAHAKSGNGDQVGDTYLATVSSALENAVIRAVGKGQFIWLGATDEAQEGVWRWVSGPEGLANGGAGTIFYGPGAAPGTYTNWTSGEPNNWNQLEHYAQGGYMAAAQWNDLPNSSLINYVRETNQAPLPLTVYGRNVTFRGEVGNLKAVGNFVMDNTGSLTLETDRINAAGFVFLAALGGETHVASGYHPVIHAGGNITINQDVRTHAADTTVQFHAGGSILANSMEFTGTAKQNLMFVADTDDDEAGGIKFYGVTLATSGGDLLLGGGSDPATGRAYGVSDSNYRGVSIFGSSITTDGGDVTMRGQGMTSQADAIGVDLGQTSLNAGGGNIALNGIGGAGTGDVHIGVSLFGATVVETGDGGTIAITGVGGGDGQFNPGINIENHSVVRQNDGNGTITLDGTGSAGAFGNEAHGIYIWNSASVLSLGTGAISLTGHAQSDYAGIYTEDSTIGDANFTGAINLTSGSDITLGGTLRTAGAGGDITVRADGSIGITELTSILTDGGDVTLNADRGAGGAGSIYLRPGASITTGGGDVVLGGGADPLTTAAYGVSDGIGGVVLDDASISAGAGDISIRGVGYNGTDSNRGVDLSLYTDGSTVETTTGDITIVGVGAGSGSNNSGVNLNYGTIVRTTAGDITITGTGSMTPALYSVGVCLDRSLVESGSGDVLITGTGGAGGFGDGITGQDGGQVVATAGGSIRLVGTPGDWANGIYFTGNGRIGGSGTGDVTLEADSIVFDGYATEIRGQGDLLIQPHTPGLGMTLGTYAVDGLVLETDVLDAIWSTFDRVIFGRDTGRGELFVYSATSPSAAMIFRGTDITLGSIAVLGDMTLDASGSVTRMPYMGMATIGLLLRGTGSFDLNGGILYVTHFASEATGAVRMTATGDVAIDTVAGVHGVSGASSVSIVTDGMLTLKQAVAATGGGNSVVLGGDTFVNNVGAGAIDPGTGRFLVYSLDPADNTRNGLAAGNLWGRTHAANAPGTITHSGNQMIYALAPTLTVAADNKSKVYGAAVPGLTYAISGYLEGDTEAVIAGAAELTTIVDASTNVGSYGISAAVGTLSSDTGYQFTFTDGVLNVTPAELTIRAKNTSRLYGAAIPTLTAEYEGLMNGDTAAAISGLTLTAAGNARSTPGSYAIHASGATASNYNITMFDGVLAVLGGTLPTETLYNETARGDSAKGGAAIEYSAFGPVERTNIAGVRPQPAAIDGAELVVPVGGLLVTFRSPADAWTARGAGGAFSGVLAASSSFNLQPITYGDRRKDGAAVTSTDE